jgi:hypothetical protein
MRVTAKVKNEIVAVGLTTLFFGVWFCMMMLLKKLVLADYQIQFGNLSMALMGALIVAKVVLIMESIPLGAWLRNRSGVSHIAVRTLMYAVGVAAVLLVEKAFEARHEYGGFIPSLTEVFHHRDISHVWATAISVTSALLIFNALFVIRRHVGKRGLIQMFISPYPVQAKDDL